MARAEVAHWGADCCNVGYPPEPGCNCAGCTLVTALAALPPVADEPFYEDDEDPATIKAQFDAGEKGITAALAPDTEPTDIVKVHAPNGLTYEVHRESLFPAAPDTEEYRTKTGRILTDSDFEALAIEAEGDHDLSKMRPRNRLSAPPPTDTDEGTPQ